MWFKELTGVSEDSPSHVRKYLSNIEDTLYSSVNNKSWKCGTLEIPSLEDLRKHHPLTSGPVTFTEEVGDVQELHKDPFHADALFQVASQFNLLEMVGPHISPEDGVGIYEHDYT